MNNEINSRKYREVCHINIMKVELYLIDKRWSNHMDKTHFYLHGSLLIIRRLTCPRLMKI
jgi:threonyl-tRNA synthetase